MRQQSMSGNEIRAKKLKARFVPPSEQIEFWPGLTEIMQGNMACIWIPCLPPSKNIWQRLHWRAQQSRFFKSWGKWFCEQYRWNGKGMKIEGKVEVRIHLHFPDNRRRDSMNYAAFPPLMDCLTTHGIIEDDNHRSCRIIIVEPIIDGTSRTILTIRKIEEIDSAIETATAQLG